MTNLTENTVTKAARTALLHRIPRDTLDAWATELSTWTPADSFRTRIDQIARSIPRSIFFRQGGLTFLREAWIASRTACALQAGSVRLVAAQRPDFEVQIGGQIEQFEATEADMDGRRRGDEPEWHDMRPDPVEDWRTRFEAIPAALDRVITKK
jgi:hypothetical protein